MSLLPRLLRTSGLIRQRRKLSQHMTAKRLYRHFLTRLQNRQKRRQKSHGKRQKRLQRITKCGQSVKQKRKPLRMQTNSQISHIKEKDWTNVSSPFRFSF
nr:MAG TPA: hypothetical protein [Caudoviricetes sp.]